MARLALGRYWNGRTDVEREEFVRLLAGLVDGHIIALERYAGAPSTTLASPSRASAPP
jgi:hypothetical protein